MSAKPVVGIIACNREVEGEMASIVKGRYIAGVADYAHCIPVLLPSLSGPGPDTKSDALALLGRLDAILLTGSASNIGPGHYGADEAIARQPIDASRDRAVLDLIDAAIDQGIALIGICRGLQEINVAFGGTLVDGRDGDGAALHHAPDGAGLIEMFNHFHPVDVAAGGILETIVGTRRLSVNSVHYQRVGRLGAGLRVEATAEDGAVEALAATDGAKVFAVQWHPEWRPSERAHDLKFWDYVGRLAQRA